MIVEDAEMQTDSATAIRLMVDFVERTGVGAEAGQQRYLWTDAFALLNALELHRETGEDRWRDIAETLIADVHRTLGRHRPDDMRTGWLSGLGENEGARHPTRGGLRIGKPLPERGPDEPYDERLEWDRDGQYWHYLTKWMDALSRAAVLLDEPTYLTYAIELAEAAYPRFLQASPSGAPAGLAWKMSVDLSRPQVAATSRHDALDGYVTFRWLGRTGVAAGLAEEAAILCGLAEGGGWATSDPLGLGGLLLDACRLAMLPDRRVNDERLIGEILTGVDVGLTHFLRQSTLQLPPGSRLGFRELGLAIGLQTLDAIAEAAAASPNLTRFVSTQLEELRGKSSVSERITSFWSDPQHRNASSWMDHRDINDVMLAAALLDAYVGTSGSPQKRQRDR
ncbi:MAG: hypothetical protein PVI23_05820 [Maricaulaceae bacterium]|jgi:hypothetical protein